MEGYISEIRLFGGNFAPRNWAFCQGQLLAISQNSALFSLVGTIYGGDGRTTFGLPDLRSRVAVGVGQGPGFDDIRQGEKGGNHLTVLSAANMPAHSHVVNNQVVVNASEAEGNSTTPGGKVWAKSGMGDPDYADAGGASASAMDPNAIAVNTTIGNAGGSQSFSNRSPYLGMNYIICLQGIFPSRN